MSHSQFRRTKTYTETCMDESLRQAYDYWQDQPGSIRKEMPVRNQQILTPENGFSRAGTLNQFEN